jgi:predicted MFS family arabinose efflux permease
VTFSLWPPVVLAVGSALALAGLTKLTVVSAVVIPIGVIALVPAARMLARAAASVARPGLSLALVAGFLLTMAFFATDGFVPLMLTRIRGRTVGEASIVVTLATVGWGLGSWWQSRVVGHRSAGWLIRLGAAGVVLGAAGVALGLASVPLVLPYLAWGVAGLGMGVAYPTVYLVTMERAGPGTEGSAVALMLLVDTLGAAVGAGLGGASVALAEGAGTDLRAGLLGAFVLAAAAGVALVILARRLTVAAAG